jgi:putative ABC transport system permease protein
MGLDAVEMPVGVVADFHNLSFYELLGPTIITVDASLDYCGMLIRVAPGTNKQVMASLEKLWQQFYPGKLLETSWVDERLAKQYEAEKKLQQLFTLFSALTTALAALGIFGLIVHAAQQRTKEIGVRKVFGASVASIARLLSFHFVKLVFLAIGVASPIAWYFLNKWLQGFAYRITISWWMFALAGSMAVLIAMLTVSFHAIKAATANPVKSLRSE